MREALEAAWRRGLAAAGRWRAGQDPTPVLEALGLALVLEVNGELGERSDDELVALRRAGPEAVAAADELARAEGADGEDWRWALGIARAGLEALAGGGSTAPRSAQGDLVPPSPQRVLRMLGGELDGLSAGSCAVHLLRDVSGRARMKLLARLEGRDVGETPGAAATGLAPLRAAAAAAEDMWAPAEGETVAWRDAPRVEAVLFRAADPPRLAVYAFDAVPLRLVSEAVETEAMLPGYWRGRIVAARAKVLRCELHVDDRVVPWRIDIRSGKPKR